MPDEAPDSAETETTPPAPSEQEDQRVPYERFQKANEKAKEAAARASDAEKRLAALEAQMQEREEAGLPELERERKRAENLEKRIADAESRAEAADAKLTAAQRERWVTQAAARADFIDPDDAARFVDLGEIEDADQAERAVKKIAKSKGHLIKQEERKLPGQVLENGKKPAPTGDQVTDERAALGAELFEGFFGGRRAG